MAIILRYALASELGAASVKKRKILSLSLKILNFICLCL
jgi:hypothetical protein